MNLHFGASAGWADARRRDAGDGTSSRSGNEADAHPPPCPFGLRPAGQQQNVKLFLREPLEQSAKNAKVIETMASLNVNGRIGLTTDD